MGRERLIAIKARVRDDWEAKASPTQREL